MRQRLPVARSPRPQARIIDPDTLEMISEPTPCRPRPTRPGPLEYQNFTGGGYFFLDDKDRIWVPTKTDHIYVLNEGADGNTLTLEQRLRPDLGARPGDRADHLGAARLQRA